MIRATVPARSCTERALLETAPRHVEWTRHERLAKGGGAA